jgi:streptogramin lyase
MEAKARIAVLLILSACAGGGGDDPDATVIVPDAYEPPDAYEQPDASPPDAQVIQVDCQNIPAGPFSLTEVANSQAIASEDLAFDAAGNLVGSNDASIFKAPRTGMRTTFVPNLSFRAGMRYAANGDLMVNNDSNGSLVRVVPTGDKTTILQSLSYPNGMEAGIDGYIYITEHDARRVRRVHPETGAFTVISNNEIQNPNGIAFNEDYTALYIGGFSGVGTIYKLPIDENGVDGDIIPWATDVGTGYLDGLAVDACGNVYVADYGASRIYRITPDGLTKTPIIDSGVYMPNMQWGSGINGWDPLTLYIPDGWDHKVYEVAIGVPSKPKAFP